MKKNVCASDRIIRIILGLVIIAWGIYAENWFGLIGIVPLMTALLNWCPFYMPFKLSTIKRGDNKQKIG
jgi:hypothetical protein